MFGPSTNYRRLFPYAKKSLQHPYNTNTDHKFRRHLLPYFFKFPMNQGANNLNLQERRKVVGKNQIITSTFIVFQHWHF